MICYIIKYAYIYYRYCAAKWITKYEQIMPGEDLANSRVYHFWVIRQNEILKWYLKLNYIYLLFI